MGRIFPSIDQILELHGPLKEGENTLLNFLDNQLDDDWKIYFKANINGNHPDLVIFNPNNGLMFYNILEEDKDTLYNHYNPQIYLDQVHYYKKKILSYILPDMGETIDESSETKPYGMVKTGIFTPHIKGRIARSLFKFPEFPKIIGKEELYAENLYKIIPGFHKKNQYMKKEWAEEIEFWLNPTIHQREPIRYLELDKNQKKHSEPKEGPHRIQGPAGSGKTIILAHRAAKLARKNYKVLIITFTVSLPLFIKDMVDNSPYRFNWKNIVFNHFHGFCLDVLNELLQPKPGYDQDSEKYTDNLVESVHQAIDSLLPDDLERLKYDAILIDEGQDFKREWYELLLKFLNKRNEIVVFSDELQNIFNRKIDWMKGRWIKLDTVFRVPKEIGLIVNSFSEEFNLNSSVPIENYAQSNLYNFERIPKPHFIWENISMKDWLTRIFSAYQKIKVEQSHTWFGDDSNIVILLPSAKHGLEAVKYFKNMNISANHVFDEENNNGHPRLKKAFWTNDPRLTISTIHKFKGCEASNVIILIPSSWHKDESLDHIVYTAMTRTQENLFVFNLNKRYDNFGDRIGNKW
ncbi:MAG: UvrD-helicase domain-containing protein [Methanobacteriaceae archaeon]|nr:UvrD-helicase domain-containing protein [Methanobacteriaceae archaeon]